MKFKVKKSSNLGQKIKAFYERRTACMEENTRFVKTLEFGDDVSWYERPGRYAGVGGIVIENITPEQKKKWKQTFFGGYFPKVNSKAGKELAKQFNAQPSIPKKVLGIMLGVSCALTQRPGLSPGHPEFYLVNFKDETWRSKTMPEDMVEITTREYHQLMGEIPEPESVTDKT